MSFTFAGIETFAAPLAPSELDETIHAFHDGRCYSAHGPDATVHALRGEASERGITVHDGACSGPTECRHWHGLRVCRSTSSGDELGGDTWHCESPNGKACVQFRGALMANAQVEAAIQSKLSERGMHMSEGSCSGAGFSTRYQGWSKDIHGIHITVWMG